MNKLNIGIMIAIVVVVGLLIWLWSITTNTNNPSPVPYTVAYLKSLGIVPATDGVNQWQYTDSKGQVWYGDAGSMVSQATTN